MPKYTPLFRPLTFSRSPRLTLALYHLPLLSLSLLLLLGSGCSKQAKTARHLKNADHYYDAKDFKKAEIEYRNALRFSPTNVVAVKRLATIYYDQGKTELALRFLYGATELDRNDTELRTKLAQLFLSIGLFQAARTNAIYVLDRSPTNDEALLLVSDTAVTPKDVIDGQQRLQKLAAQAGNRAAWHLAMANLYLRQTNYTAAEGALRKALALEPRSSRVHLAWGAFYWLQKDLKNAGVYFQKAAELDPLKPAVWLRWADFKLNTGSAKECQELLQQITQKMPDSTPAWVYLARVDFDLQNFQECSNIVAKVLSRDQGHSQARLLHARLQRVQGKPGDAIKELEELKRAYKGSPEIEFELGLARLANRERSKAATDLQEALRLNPNYTQAILLLAELNIQKGEPASAVSSLQTLVQKQPDVTRAQFLLGSAYSAQGRFNDALALYGAMETRFPTNPAVPFLMGLTLRQQQNRNGEARTAFQRALNLATNDLLVSYHLVDLDILDHNYPAAFQRVQGLLASNPKSAGGKFLEARIFFAQTNFNAAEKALQTALEWEPNFGSAYNLLTQTYVAANKLPEALAKLEQMLEKNPKSIRVLMEMADIFDKKGDTTKAAKTYQNLLNLAPQFTPALNNFAYLLSEKLGKIDEAYAAASKAKELAPQAQQPYIADTLGWIYFRRHEYSRALVLLQESVTGLPQEPDIQFHFGMAHYMMGQEQNARLAFKRALEKNQDFPSRAEAQKRLAFLELDPNTTDQAAITALQDQIRQQPDDLPALLRLGRIYEKTGAPEKARQAYEDARKANPGSAPVLLQLAQLYSTTLKNPQQALALAREARNLAPDDAEVAHTLGRLADQSGDHQWASSLLQESAQKQPGNPEVLFDLAHALYAIGNVNDAEDAMRRAVQAPSSSPPLVAPKPGEGGSPFNPQEAQSFLNLITLSKSPEKRLEAEPQVQQFLQARPNYLPALMVSGLIHEQRGRIPEAKQAYEKLIKESPQFAPARKQLAALYTDQLNDQQKALEQASKAREALPDDPDLAKTLGKIAYRRSDYRNAVRFLQESSLKLPNDSEVFYFLGLAHNQLKAKDESKRALERALTLNPNAPFAAEARKVLADLRK